uniref:G/T mismatch-specific thymine DNA glycosylase n=1 Tax=Iconisemion striatum TaxID=60296 RepID=A0A1A7Y8X1_9TELE
MKWSLLFLDFSVSLFKTQEKMYDSYQASQQHPDTQHMMSYHQMDGYPEGPGEDLPMSVQSDLSMYRGPVYHNYPPAPNHYQEQVCKQNFSEHQHQQYHAVQQPLPHHHMVQQQLMHQHMIQQHPQHQHMVQQEHRYQHTVHQHLPRQHLVQQQPQHLVQHQHTVQQQEPGVQSSTPPQALTPLKKKRGRPSKQQADNKEIKEEEDEAEAAKKAKRTLNRFNGMSVDEVMTKTLPDVITYNLDILIIGINPGLLSAFKGHHYPNPGNHFWKCLFLSGLTEQQLNYMHDHSLPEKYSIGFTNMVERTTPGSKDLSSKEIREGGRQLLDKLQKYKPLIAAFNGKGIYEIFCKEIFGVKAKSLEFGLQPYKIPETKTVCFLMPSSSPRCAQFPRAQDKVHFYIKLKELRDQMKGLTLGREVVEMQYSFDLQLAKEDAKRMAIKEEQVDPEYESCSGLQNEARQNI